MAAKMKRRKEAHSSGDKQASLIIETARESYRKRSSFVIDYTITLLSVAFLLIAALFAGLEAQDESSKEPSLGGGNQARRALLAPDVSMSGGGGGGDAQKAAPETYHRNLASSEHKSKTLADDNSGNSAIASLDDDSVPTDQNQPSTDAPEKRKVTLSAVSGISQPMASTSKATGSSTKAPPTVISTSGEQVSSRQTRATTAKKHISDSSASTTQPSTSSTSPTSSTSKATEDDEDEEEEESKPTTPPTKPKRRRRRKKKPTADSVKSAPGSDEDNDEEQTDTGLEERQKSIKAARNKKLIKQHQKNATMPSANSATTKLNQDSATSERAPLKQAASISSTTQSSEANAKLSTAPNRKNDSSKNRLSAPALGSNLSGGGGARQPIADSSLDHEYYDDDEPVVTGGGGDSKLAAIEKPVDFSKVKLVGLDKYNESVAINQSSNHSNVTAKPIPKSEPIIPSAATAPLNQIETMPTNDHRLSGELLDSRSPSAQSATGGFAKRLTNILTDSKNKLLRPTATTTTTTTPLPPTSPSSAVTRFAYSKPYSPATMIAPTEQRHNLTADGMFVQILTSNDSISRLSSTLNNSESDNIDWSKLVKVVFKSARDNHTVYTVVMNSSELSNHPISDWSNELPKLLQGDFEKLIQKWSNVFPLDHLMIDLGKIIINKVSASPTTNASLSTSPVLAKLNETIPLNGTTHFGGSDSVKHPPLKATPTMFSANNITNPINVTQTPMASNKTTYAQLQSHYQNHTHLFDLAQANNATALKNSSLPSLTFDTNPSMTSSSPRGLNVSMDYIKSTTPWSSSRDLSNLNETQKRGVLLSNNSRAFNRSLADTGKTSSQFVTVGSNIVNIAAKPANVSDTLSDGHLKAANKDGVEDHHLAEIMKDMNEDHIKLGNDVKEQAGSLRHFIIICSVSVVLAISLIMVLVLKLFK